MNDQRKDRKGGESVSEVAPWFTSTRRERILAGGLALVYLAGWTLAGYAHSIRLDELWPARVFWVVFAAWLATMLVLPLVVVCWFFAGIDRSPGWLRGRFSVHALLILITLVAIVLGAIVGVVEIFNPAA
jgi:hypothetical protein